jgi:hypothetical protein
MALLGAGERKNSASTHALTLLRSGRPCAGGGVEDIETLLASVVPVAWHRRAR